MKTGASLPRQLAAHSEQLSAFFAKAFRGELVPQDPTDEPASILLERIMSGGKRGIVPPKRKRRKREEPGNPR